MENTAIMNENRLISASLMPWLVCLTAGLFFYFEDIQMMIINSMSGQLMHAFSLTAEQVGKLSGAYFNANVIFLIPAGMILDRVSTRLVILIALSICVVGTFLFSTANSLAAAEMFRFLTGIGSAFCLLAGIRLASRWFPPKKLALVTGVLITMAMLGGMTAQTPMTLLTQHFGWRAAVRVDGVLGVIVLFLIWLWVKDYPKNKTAEMQQHQDELKSLGYLPSLKKAFLRGQNWLCGIYASVMCLPIFVLGGMMGSQYLQRVDRLSATKASLVVSALFLGNIIGSPAMGWFSDHIGLRRKPMLFSVLISLGVILLIMGFGHLSFVSLILLFLALGFITSAQVISYPTVVEGNSTMITAMSVSVVSVCIISGAAIFDPLFGGLMDMHWAGKIVDHMRVYSVGDFRFAMWLFPIAFVVAFVIAFFIKETYCQRVETADNYDEPSP